MTRVGMKGKLPRPTVPDGNLHSQNLQATKETHFIFQSYFHAMGNRGERGVSRLNEVVCEHSQQILLRSLMTTGKLLTEEPGTEPQNQGDTCEFCNGTNCCQLPEPTGHTTVHTVGEKTVNRNYEKTALMHGL